MKFTFGIITGDKTLDKFRHYYLTFCETIQQNNIKDYEIIIVGSDITADRSNNIAKLDLPGTSGSFWILDNESNHPNWITRKKNCIIKEAKYENIVLLHDYVVLDKNWYKGFLEFGDDWDVCMTRINNLDGTRFRDWITWDDPDFGGSGQIFEKWCPNGLLCKGGPTLVPYDYNKTHLMYVSGTYWVAKKQFMLDNPLDESLSWGEGEDVEWSLRVREKWNYKMNTLSSVSLLKQK